MSVPAWKRIKISYFQAKCLEGDKFPSLWHIP